VETENKKVNFFNRIRIAIFKLEDYGLFLGERFSVALKYFLLLICIVSLIMTSLDSYDFNKMINKVYSYIQNELPDFSYENEKLSVPNVIEAYDEEYNFKLIIDTDAEITEDNIVKYKNKIYDSGAGLLALEEKIVYIANNYETEYTYKYFLDALQTDIKNKDDINKLLNETTNLKEVLIISFVITDFIIIYSSNIISIFLDILLVGIFGLIAARFAGMRFKTSPMIALAIYSMTLSIILLVLYRILNFFTGFIIEYFNIMYLLVAYVYIIAAIMMIKYDLIKQQIELTKILEVQKQVHEELEEEKEQEQEQNKEKDKEEKKDKEKKDKEETDLNGVEPDGSEI